MQVSRNGTVLFSLISSSVFDSVVHCSVSLLRFGHAYAPSVSQSSRFSSRHITHHTPAEEAFRDPTSQSLHHRVDAENKSLHCIHTCRYSKRKSIVGFPWSVRQHYEASE